MIDIAGKVVAITGASRGLGRHFVERLVGEGLNVACLARPSPELNDLARTLPDVLPIECDIGEVQQCDDAIRKTIERFGKLDAVVNNAGVYEPFLIEDSTPEQIMRLTRVNYLGPIWMTRAAIPHLRATKGQIISVSSETVRWPYPFLSMYASSKAGMESFHAAMRDELRSDQIRVSILRSGHFEGGAGHVGDVTPVMLAFADAASRTGHAAWTGKGFSMDSMADALVALLRLAPDVNIDLMEVRGTVGGHVLRT